MLKPMSQRFPAEAIERDESTPERNLLAACLERAMRDILNENDQAICRVAIEWFRSQAVTDFSFKWICHHLDLCPKIIRRWIFERKKEGKCFPAYENRGHFFNTDKVLNRTKRAELLNEGVKPTSPDTTSD